MHNKIKVIHIIGVAMFFGSILGHAIAGVVSASSSDPAVFNIVRQVIEVETVYLTLPGLVMFTLSGIAMIVIGKMPVHKIKWLAVHVAVGVLVILNAFIVLIPVGTEILVASQNVMVGSVSSETILALKNREAVFGAFNIVACLVLITLAVIKPKFGHR
ncbi:MAG: DUF2269 family protein [Gammaproteobacteria bacterium]|nr:DUF2269 family protein [Gammaproteobacteria bacterium]